MIFEPIEDAYALVNVDRQGLCESKLYRCSVAWREHERYIRRGGYYVKISPKLGVSEVFYTSKSNVKVLEIFPSSEAPVRIK